MMPMAAPDSTASMRQTRRARIVDHPNLYGVDFAELVRGADGKPVIVLHFLPSAVRGKDRIPAGLDVADIQLRIPGRPALPVVGVAPDARLPAVRLTLAPGALPPGSAQAAPRITIDHPLVDPMLNTADVIEGGERELDSDPLSVPPPPAATSGTSTINYLAKDYPGFRTLILEQMGRVAPDLSVGHPAGIGTAIVEVLAYEADRLSYMQDAVATEAYLATARKRTSLRRHARLLDYRVGEGHAPRIWLRIEATAEAAGHQIPTGLQVHFTMATETATGISAEQLRIRPSGRLTFETLEPISVRAAHNLMRLYTWGAPVLELPAGATAATLAGGLPDLSAGDVLIVGQRNGEGDRLHPIRLCEDPVVETDPLTGEAVTRIAWFAEDALPFALRSAAAAPDLPGSARFYGNVVLAEAGTMEETTGLVPARGRDGRWRIRLDKGRPLFAAPFDPPSARRRAATDLMRDGSDRAQPVLSLRSGGTDGWWSGQPWHIRSDLLRSRPFDSDAMLDEDLEDYPVVLFGDGRQGRAPAPGEVFTVRYRVGPQVAMVGIDAVMDFNLPDAQVRSDPVSVGMLKLSVARIVNPMPSFGDAAPEPASRVRRAAPRNFRLQRRCASLADHERIAAEDRRVIAAVARTEWSGSWPTTIVHLLGEGGADPRPAVIAEVREKLRRFRLIDADVEGRPPVSVPIQIGATVHVAPGFGRHAVERDCRAAIAALFAPGRWGFGQPVHASKVIAALMETPGVSDVNLTALQRWGQAADGELEAGRILLRSHEIARLENRPGEPWTGLFAPVMEGGR